MVYGQLAFYRQNLEDKPGVEKLYAAIDTGGNKIYYSFYPDKIMKTTENEKQLSFTTIYGQLERPYDPTLYRKFSPLDSIVLARGDSLLNAAGLTNFKRAKGAIAYVIQVYWYHGYPKNSRFRPL